MRCAHDTETYIRISATLSLILYSSLLRDDLKIARRIYQGRTVDPLTGEPLTIDDLLAAYIERKKSESDSQDELASAMRPEVDVVSHVRSLQDENAVELQRMHLDHKVSE